VLPRDTRVGVELGALEPGAGGGVVFVDAMKQAAPWSSGRPLVLDADGNVARLAPGQSAETAIYLGEPYPAGDYLLLYDGKGRIDVDPRSGSIAAERRGRMTVRIRPDPSYGIRLRLSATDPADHLRNLRLILPGFEQSYAAQPFHPLFLRALAPFAVLRFDRWMHAGTPGALAWDRRTTPRGATQARAEGVAPEYLVALANATGADPWFAFPAGADDDYVARFAALVAAQLDPRLTPVFECGADVWRAGTPANAAAFAGGLLNRSARGSQSPALGWYAARSARVAALVRQAFAASGRRPQIVVSGPLALPGTDGEALDRAILAATAGVADAFAVSATSGTDPAGTNALAAGVAASAGMARGARLPLIAYEADVFGVAHSALPAPLAAAYLARARSAQGGALYASFLETWHGAGGGLIVTEPLVQAAYAAPTGGLLERVDQDPLASPKYRGVLSYVSRHPVPRVVPAPRAPGEASPGLAPSGLAAAGAARAPNGPRPAGRARTVPPRRPPPASGTPRRAHATAPNSYAQAVLADGPLAFYQLDDTGSVAVDSSPNGLNGSVGTSVGEGAPSLLVCCGAKGMLFPGTTSTAGTVLVPPNAAFELSANASMEALLRFSAAPTDYSVPFGYGNDSGYAPYDLYFTRSGQLNAQFNLTSGPLVATMAGALQPNVTYHVAATYDGATARLYVNGSQVASAARAGTLAGYDPQHGFAIGDDAGFSDPGFGGTLSDVAVYAKALTAAQVQSHYQASRTVATPAPTPTPGPASYASTVLASGPAAYYRLNDTGTRAVDSSPNHLDGTSGASVRGGAPSLLATSADPATSYPGIANASGATVVPPSALLRPSGAVTMECFLQFASAPPSWTVPLSYGTDIAYAPYDLYFTRNGTLNAQFTLSSGVLVVTDPAPLRANTPYHIVATYDGAVGRLYVNGAQVASAAQSGTLTAYDTTYGLAIGDDAGYSDPPFTGTIEQVAIYTKALSATDVANHYVAATGMQPQVLVDWPTFHADALRTGWNQRESQLTASNVNAASFGLRASLAVDGQVYAEPLVAANETVPGIGTQNLLIVATANDTVYAFEADTGAPIWTRSFTGAGITAVPWTDSGCNNVAPTIGIVSTPVLDRARDTLYVVAATDETAGAATTTHIRLHALSLQNGADKLAPADIGGSVPQTGGGTIPFLPQWQMSRASLLEANGAIYVAFASHCDYGGQRAHGWLFAYDAGTLAPAGSIFNTTTDPTTSTLTLGAIWGSGFGPAADARGTIYTSTGNGTDYDGGHNLPQSVLAIAPGLGFPALSSFTTGNQSSENAADLDLASGGVLVLPDQPGATPHLAIAGGKTGITYVLNRDGLGGYVPGGPDNALYEAATNGGVWGGPAYYVGADGNPYLIVSGGNDPLQRYRLQLSPSIALVPAGQAAAPIGSVEGGTIPVVSSNGTLPGTAVVWALSRPSDTTTPIVLNAYDGANLSRLLFQASTHPWTNVHGDALVAPTVANGKVYVPTGSTVDIFGLK
jgi:hypothetical protein